MSETYFKYKINNIPIVYEDDWFMIVNKPAGLLVVPTPKKEPHTLTSILNNDLQGRGLSYKLHPCHRLDRETSGLIIYAKGKSLQKKMMDEFKHRRVKKTYIAFVQGMFSRKQGQINIPVEGQKAITKYKIMEVRKDFTVVSVRPLTGRRNQIRIHFKGISHPLVGETRFAFRKDCKLKAKRVCLHAKTLEFTHPVTHKLVSMDSELAPDLKDFLKKYYH